MAKDYRSLKRTALQDSLERLAEQYAAALEQSASAIDAAAAVQARQQAEAIDKRMQDTQRELDHMELSLSEPNQKDDTGRDPGRVHDLLRERLHRIDFRQVERAIRRVLDADTERGRAGLLLFEHCSRMNGRRCAERIASILKAEGGELFQPYPIGLRHGDRNGAGALLRHIAPYFNLDIEARTRPEQLARVSESLTGSLQAGSIALIEVGGCDWLTYDEPEALHWLVTDFWRCLLADLETAARKLLPGTVTLIVLLFFDGEVPAGARDPALPAAEVRSTRRVVPGRRRRVRMAVGGSDSERRRAYASASETPSSHLWECCVACAERSDGVAKRHGRRAARALIGPPSYPLRGAR